MDRSDHRCFSIEVNDIPLHFQFILLEKQCYIWVAAGQPRMGSLFVAMPTKLVSNSNLVAGKKSWPKTSTNIAHKTLNTLQDSIPSCTSLLPGNADYTSLTMAQRIGQCCFEILKTFSVPISTSFYLTEKSHMPCFICAVRKSGIPIALSVNIPSESDTLRIAAERRIVDELLLMQQERKTKNLQL